MSTLLSVLDVAILLLLIASMLRIVGGFGSAVLTVLIGIVAIVFATVSLGAFTGLAGESSVLTQVILLAVLLGMASLMLSFWKTKSPS
jgi:hypothetical protein